MKNTNTLFSLLILLILAVTNTAILASPPDADEKDQVIRGQIVDAQSMAPVKQAIIEVLNHSPRKVAYTDHNGYFRMDNVPIGRHKIVIKHALYEPLMLNGIQITSGKQISLVLNMEEVVAPTSPETRGEIRPILTLQDAPINDMALTNVRSFMMEEVVRFAGDRLDPARLAGNYAGIHSEDDHNNHLVIRGNTPTAMQWRLEGLPIPNPNHLGGFHSTGGQYNILNPNTLNNSEILLGAFPAEYGNALSGVFDVHLRPGNTETPEFLLQYSSVTGVEAMIEGPIGKRGASFLVNYRHSLFNPISYQIDKALGTSVTPPQAAPNFQDFTFRLDLAKGKWGELHFFGLGGFANQFRNGTDSSIAAQDQYIHLHETEQFNSIMGLAGLHHRVKAGRQGYWQSSAAVSYFSYNDQLRYIDPITQDTTALQSVDDAKTNVIINSFLHQKLSKKLALRMGVQAELYNLNIDQLEAADQFGHLEDSSRLQLVRSQNQALFGLMSTYGQVLYKPTHNLKFNLGLRGQYLSYNQDWTVEPRVSGWWAFLPRHILTAGYGLHSKMQPLELYLHKASNEWGQTTQYNRNLGFTRAHHLVGGYNFLINDNWRFRVEAYHQEFFDVPIDSIDQNFSMLNYGGINSLPHYDGLYNGGQGTKQGVELTLEKFFSKGYYLIATASRLRTSFTAHEQVQRESVFGDGYIVHLLAGREIKLGIRQLNRLTFDFKLAYNDGEQVLPIDTTASLALQTSVYEESEEFNRMPDYLRLDFKVGIIINDEKHKIAHQFFVDILNVTNRKNAVSHYFSRTTQSVERRYGLPIYLDLLYRVRF